MSYNSIHMNHPIPKGYIRGGTAIVKIEDMLKMDREKLREPNTQLYGQTKWPDPTFLIIFIDHNFELSAAAEYLRTSPSNYKRRLLRINARDWMEIMEKYKLIHWDKLTKKNFLSVKPRKRKRKSNISTLEVKAAMERNNNNAAKAAKELGCSTSTVYNRMMRIKP